MTDYQKKQNDIIFVSSADHAGHALAHDGEIFQVTTTKLAELQAMYPTLNILGEVVTAEAWYAVNQHEKEKTDFLLKNWLRKSDREARVDAELAALKRRKLELEIRRLEDQERERGHGHKWW